jgi:protein arginine kinase activator
VKKCIRCSKPATLHITDIREGQVHALHLCETCAHDYLSGGTPSHAMTDAEALAEKIQESGGDRDDLEQLVCPSCGVSYQEFRSEGRLGCPHDYQAFESELTPLIENIHGDTQHTGKCPKRAPDASRRQFELVKLRSELRSAVENEQFESAADLRDRIIRLETGERGEDD